VPVRLDGTQGRGEHRQGSAASGAGACRWFSDVQWRTLENQPGTSPRPR
jgi:hypothetical protein